MLSAIGVQAHARAALRGQLEEAITRTEYECITPLRANRNPRNASLLIGIVTTSVGTRQPIIEPLHILGNSGIRPPATACAAVGQSRAAG